MTLPTPQQQISANQKLIRAIEADKIQRTHERQRRLSSSMDYAFERMQASADLQIKQLIEDTNKLCCQSKNN